MNLLHIFDQPLNLTDKVRNVSRNICLIYKQQMLKALCVSLEENKATETGFQFIYYAVSLSLKYLFVIFMGDLKKQTK